MMKQRVHRLDSKNAFVEIDGVSYLIKINNAPSAVGRVHDLLVTYPDVATRMTEDTMQQIINLCSTSESTAMTPAQFFHEMELCFDKKQIKQAAYDYFQLLQVHMSIDSSCAQKEDNITTTGENYFLGAVDEPTR